MMKFTQRVLIMAAAQVVIVGGLGVADLLGQASADPGSCIGASASCQQVDISGQQSRGTLVCQPIGPKAGAFCREFVPYHG
jgi:hypothetical protein